MITVIIIYLLTTYALGIIGALFSLKNNRNMGIMPTLFMVIISPLIMPYVIYVAYKIATDKSPKVG